MNTTVYHNCHRLEVRDTTLPQKFNPVYYWVSDEVPAKHGNKSHVCASLEEYQHIWYVVFPDSKGHMGFGTQEAAERWIESERCRMGS
ncbi:unnamed protein product [Sphagnum jensenii]